MILGGFGWFRVLVTTEYYYIYIVTIVVIKGDKMERENNPTWCSLTVCLTMRSVQQRKLKILMPVLRINFKRIFKVLTKSPESRYNVGNFGKTLTKGLLPNKLVPTWVTLSLAVKRTKAVTTE